MGKRRGGRMGRPISCTYCKFGTNCPIGTFYTDLKDCHRYNMLIQQSDTK